MLIVLMLLEDMFLGVFGGGVWWKFIVCILFLVGVLILGMFLNVSLLRFWVVVLIWVVILWLVVSSVFI